MNLNLNTLKLLTIAMLIHLGGVFSVQSATLYNRGKKLNINNSTHLNVQGTIVVADTSQINNKGTIWLANHWINNSKNNFVVSGNIHFIGREIQRISGFSTKFSHFFLNTNGIKLFSDSLSVVNSLTFKNGVIFSRHGICNNYINLLDSALYSGASNTSHISGRVRKYGNSNFEFPTGKNGKLSLIAVSEISEVKTHFTAEYFNNSTPHINNTDTNITAVNANEFWDLQGTDSAKVTVVWRYDSLKSNQVRPNLANARIVLNPQTNKPKWENQGDVFIQKGSNNNQGTITTAQKKALFGLFTTAYKHESGVITLGDTIKQEKTPAEAKVPLTVNDTSLTSKMNTPFQKDSVLVIATKDDSTSITHLEAQPQGAVVIEAPLAFDYHTEEMECKIYFPTAFSPNYDGVNDIYYGKTVCNITEVEWVIYDRWGEVIFVSNELENGWDGTYRGEEAPTGTYVRHARYALANGYVEEYDAGVITLIR